MGKSSTSVKPGQVLNPNGRPKKAWTMASLIRDAAEEEDENGVPRKVAIAKKLAELAAKGEMVAVKEFNQRMDGMPIQKNILAGDEENPISIDVAGVLKKVYGKPRPDSVGGVSKDS